MHNDSDPPPCSDTWPPPPPAPGGYVLEPVLRHGEPACAVPVGYELGADEFAAGPDEPISLRLVDGFERAIPVRA